MPPRRSARVATAAEHASSALSPLPHAVVLHIFSLLPADARARAACVCRGWRVTLFELSLWTRLNLSPSSGVRVRMTDAVLAGAAAKARGQLAALDVFACNEVSFDALLAVVRANGGALRELCAGTCGYHEAQTLNLDRVERLLLAAPQLAACHAEVFGITAVTDARRMLRNEAPFQPLRVRGVFILLPEDADEASALALAADLAAHAWLKRVNLIYAPLHMPLVLDSVVDAALARQLESLSFLACRLSPASAPALVRLLGGATLTDLQISQPGPLLDDPSGALLGDALRANNTLTALSFPNVDLWHHPDAAAALLSALTGHPSLCKVCLVLNRVVAPHVAAAGAAFGALVAANAPALTALDLSICDLGDEGLRPLFEALPLNTHLRTLDVADNDMSAAFARDVQLPAVRANTSLRKLLTSARDFPESREAEALVAARAAAAAAAE
jgi:hypothetical protein